MGREWWLGGGAGWSGWGFRRVGVPSGRGYPYPVTGSAGFMATGGSSLVTYFCSKAGKSRQ
jgi:hypothetical protein